MRRQHHAVKFGVRNRSLDHFRTRRPGISELANASLAAVCYAVRAKPEIEQSFTALVLHCCGNVPKHPPET